MPFIAKTNDSILQKLQKACFTHFWTLLAQILLFSKKKYLHHLKRIMVSYLYAKKYKKQLNGPKDLAVSEIKRFYWSRAFTHKS